MCGIPTSTLENKLDTNIYVVLLLVEIVLVLYDVKAQQYVEKQLENYITGFIASKNDG